MRVCIVQIMGQPSIHLGAFTWILHVFLLCYRNSTNHPTFFEFLKVITKQAFVNNIEHSLRGTDEKQQCATYQTWLKCVILCVKDSIHEADSSTYVPLIMSLWED